MIYSTAMKFVHASSEVAISKIARAVNKALDSGSVLLLVSGGSNINLAVEIRHKLALNNQLTVGLIDERYGPVGHPDSNWTQLMKAGFNTQDVNLLPVMHDERSQEAATADYRDRLQAAVNECTLVIGIFGIGTDGHTSGILPGSPAIDSSDTVTHFIGPDFPRITTTPLFMPSVNQAFLVSYGEAKHQQLARLRHELPVSEQPAQTLKQISDLTIFSDYDEGLSHE